MTPEQQAQTTALAIESDPVVAPLLNALTSDPGFQAAWQSLDVPAFTRHLETATGHLQQVLSSAGDEAVGDQDRQGITAR